MNRESNLQNLPSQLKIVSLWDVMRNYSLLIQQPAIPSYQIPFFQKLIESFDGLSILIECNENFQGTYSAGNDTEIFATNKIQYFSKNTKLPGSLSWFHSKTQQRMQAGDVIVLAGNPRILSNYALMYRAKRNNIGLVWWGHGYGATSTTNTTYIRLKISNICNVRLFYDDNEAELIFKIANEPNIYINNTIQYSDTPPSFARNIYDASFCFCGRLTEKSGVDKIPAILSKLIALGHADVSIKIIGSGPLKEQVLKNAESMGISDKITFYGEIQERNQTSQIMQQCKYFLYPGSIGLSAMHSLSEGLPVITHNNLNTHMPEARRLNNGFNAFLGENSLEGLLEASIRALTIKDLTYEAMRINCLTIRTSHSVDIMVARFLEACDLAHQLALSS